MEGFDVGARVGPYVIESVLGRGGMGAVYRARHHGTGHLRALKVLLSDTVKKHPEATARFLREAALAASVEHSNVARVFDAFEHEGAWVIPMEFIAGETLDHHLRGPGKTRRALPEPEVVALMQGICAGVEAIHARGVVHRDLKPQNIMLVKSAEGAAAPRIVDFGTAKHADNPEELTGANIFLGTPAYASPEQTEARRDLDARADVWSLGVIAYQMLTARRPYEGSGDLSIARKVIRHDPFTPPRAHVATLSAPIERAVLHALTVDRAQRTPSARAFADALTLACVPEGASTRVGVERPAPAPRPDRRPFIAIAIALVVALVPVLVALSHRTAPSATHAASAPVDASIAEPPPAPIVVSETPVAMPVTQPLLPAVAPAEVDAGPAPTASRPRVRRRRCRPRPGIVCPPEGL